MVMKIDDHYKGEVMSAEEKAAWEILEQIPDPEIPVLSILDLGIVRSVNITHGQTEIIITPTYSGCPAMDMISMQIRMELASRGFEKIQVRNQLSPAWTTDWMTEKGKSKLREYGIAAPLRSGRLDALSNEEVNVRCPRCNSGNTKLLSQFGSTACKALYQCQDCKEPFDYFKCH